LTVRVYQGELLIGDLNTEFPELPPDMSTRSFVETMFTRPA